MRLALGSSVLLVAAGLVAFAMASRAARHAAPSATADTVTVTVRDGACDPAELSVPAGRSVFRIVNASSRAVEWEILDGVMVLEERENIAPGLTQTLTAKLSPGTFQITCGLLSNPRGKLTVLPSAASAQEAARPPVTSFLGPLAEYRVYAVLEAGSLVQNTRALADAITSGDLAQARSLYGPAHQAYEHLAPAAQMFADLDTRINARATYFAQREADPAFGGFQRIAYGMGSNSLQGLAPVAAQLLTDVQELQERLRGLQLAPDRLAAAASRSMQKLAGAGPSSAGFEDLASQLAGVQKIVDVLRPLLARARPELLTRLDADFAALSPAPPAPPAPQATLAAPLQALAQDIAQINPALGLE
ncbi:MAG: multidrug transporter permease [Rhodoferax sp.]|nr:multidrug transporter permease [Rhodoferax sp.]